MKVCIEEKDSHISTLEERIKEVENKSDLVIMQQKEVIIQQNVKIDKLEKSNEEMIKDLELLVEKLPYQTVNPPLNDEKQIKCMLFDFKTCSEQEMKVYMTRKHTKISPVKYAKKCELCEK